MKHFFVSLCLALLVTSPLAAQIETKPTDNPSVRKLASDLVSAKTVDERAVLLSSQKDLVTHDLSAELMRLGDESSTRAEYTKALTAYDLAERVSEQLHDEGSTAAVLNAMGRVYSQQGQHAKSLELRQRALSIYEKLDDKAAVAEVLNDIGVSYRRQSNYEVALEYYARSLALREQLGDREGMATTLTSMGVALDARGDYSQAIAYHQRALALREAINDPDILLTIYNNLGATYRNLGDYSKAIDYYNQALNHPRTAKDPVGASIYLRNIGTAYMDQGDYRNAHTYLSRGLSIIEHTDDKVGIATAYNLIGVVYRWQGNYALALDYYNRSLKLREELGDRSGIATNHNNIGRVYFLMGDQDRALEHLQKALEIREAIKTKSAITTTLSLIGAIHLARGDFDLALTNLTRSLKVAEEIGDRRGMTEALLYSARALRNQRQNDCAMEMLTRASAIASQIGNPELYWQVRLLSGQIHGALGDRAKAAEDFQEAIRIIEGLRQHVSGGERERQMFFENKVVPYQEMIKLSVASNQPMEALRFAERAKARVLIDVLSRGRNAISKSMTPAEQENEQKLEAALTSLNAQLALENLRPAPDQAQLTNLRRNLQQARLDLEEFHASLYAAHPELKVFRGEEQALTEQRLLTLVPNQQTALLEFAAAGDKEILFVIERVGTTLQTKAYMLASPTEELSNRAEQFRRAIAQRDPIEKDARELYELLLKPARTSLVGKTSLVIVPSTMLWGLPFQALQSAPNHFMLEDAAISYAPSLTALIEMKRAGAQMKVGSPNLLAFANPAISGGSVEQSPRANANAALPPLPEAEAEAAQIGRLYGSQNSSVLIGAEAKEERVKSAAGQFRILHFATHGILDNSSPMYSHVVLASPGNQSKEDGLLEAREIMDLDLHADLVVLSACETARGQISQGEGVIGLSWALFVAGTPTTVASQWKVPSKSTADLMLDFHRNLLGKYSSRAAPMSKARALQQASLNQLRRGPFRHPFYWAGFVVIGDPESLQMPR